MSYATIADAIYRAFSHTQRFFHMNPRPILSSALRRSAFSLIELVIVVVIIGIIGAIAIPRFSSASESSAKAALVADLKVLREAIDLYSAEHGGTYPTSLTALTGYTSEEGSTIAGSKSKTYYLGPYIRAIPACPTGSHRGATGWAATGNNPPGAESPAAHVGWLYHSASGNVWVNDNNHFDK
jgi:prepilin-type N-terminal cleavage/methylation domain-containing protein